MAVPDQEELLRGLTQALTLLGEGMAAVAQELRLANEIRMHGFFVGQLDHAIGDPVLAAALSTLDGLSVDQQRQMLFANREYGLLLLAHRVGVADRSELLGHLKVLSKNSLFAEYWRLTSEHRQELPPDSLEARTGRAVDAIMEERLDDLEGWWVVGPDSGAPSDC
ncbi:hypothetical protein ADK57_30500 [Streptomyces sp. MMG1533]|uniref:DUF6082 family protein n=1 Tax=Streptomyces sp. MMG1533 TaxID=1415546 RepID=UPI0006B01481|nr:DUF6082 family protein [Streptomyces sp. MMG1533]KOU60317.1 hypothetical protein ADK57_30500 [Streptomyces sp. MMG1533]